MEALGNSSNPFHCVAECRKKVAECRKKATMVASCSLCSVLLCQHKFLLLSALRLLVLTTPIVSIE